MRQFLKKCQTIVIKAGTSILTSKNGRISKLCLERLGRELLPLIGAGRQVVLVSSGAIAYGMQINQFKKRPKEMAALQACAAIGQGKLMHAYEQFFLKNKITTAQILLTRDALETRKRFLAARNTLRELYRMAALPIVNENDTVATEEIAFGDNDVLSVQVAHLVHADLLILLSDVSGFFLKDGTRIPEVASVAEIDRELVKHLKDVRKEKTVGGMRAKLEAARLAMKLGVPMMIVDGHEEGIIQKIFAGENVGTLFCAEKEKKSAREKWIGFSAPRKGVLKLDRGAFRALSDSSRSLLPSGITQVIGNFEKGQIVELQGPDGEILGRGMVKYSSREIALIAGKNSADIKSVLGYKSKDEVIHRNDLVIWK